jgi:hypothetical protein
MRGTVAAAGPLRDDTQVLKRRLQHTAKWFQGEWLNAAQEDPLDALSSPPSSSPEDINAGNVSRAGAAGRLPFALRIALPD